MPRKARYKCPVINNMSPTASQIGEWLRAARLRAKKTREEAAPQVGTTIRTLARWEDGEAAPPADQFFAMVLLYRADVLTLLARKFRGGEGGTGRARAAGED